MSIKKIKNINIINNKNINNINIFRNIKNITNIFFIFKKQDLLRKILFWVLFSVFFISALLIIKKLYGYYNDDMKYQKLRAYVHSGTSIGKDTDNEDTTAESTDWQGNVIPYVTIYGNPSELDKNGIISEFTFLKKVNSDLVGWVSMPGFNKPIDYPVLHCSDNEFYLKHDFYKNESQAGSVFMDKSNNPQIADRHIILYGHAMLDKSMFGNLKEFPDNPLMHINNTKIFLDMLNTRLEYEVFSTYFADAKYNYRQTSFSSDSEYLSFLEKILVESVYNYNVKLTSNDKIITLSTCNNDRGSNIRSVTHARLVRQIIYTGDSNNIMGNGNSSQSNKEVISANVYFKNISLEYGDPQKPSPAVFDPVFSSNLREFYTSLPEEENSARLIFEKSDPEAQVTVSINGKKTDGEDSGKDAGEYTINSYDFNLENGDNVIKLFIVSRDKKFARTIIIRVSRTNQALPASEMESKPEPEAASAATQAATP